MSTAKPITIQFSGWWTKPGEDLYDSRWRTGMPWKHHGFLPVRRDADYLLVLIRPLLPGYPPSRCIGISTEPSVMMDHYGWDALDRCGTLISPYRGRPGTFLNPSHVPCPWRVPTDKPKRMSIVVSPKRELPMHRYRTDVLRWLLDSKLDIDIYGDHKGTDSRLKGYIEHKADALLDYKYTIAIENSIERGYASEKVIDGIVAGCKTLYIGDPWLSVPSVQHLPLNVEQWPAIFGRLTYNPVACRESLETFRNDLCLPAQLRKLLRGSSR